MASLPYDGAWTEITDLLQCTVGKNLVPLERRDSSGGYRISTPITHTTRARTAQPER